MQDVKEEVRSRLNIEDVIGEYVQLKRAGRNWKGLSPFTSERTPSFIVSPDKQIWHDFSSNKGGDVFAFIMEVEGLDFRATLELLARKAGIDMSSLQGSGAGQDLSKKKQRLLSALDLAATYYQHSLLKNKHALEYVFNKRKLSKEIVQSFRIGYAPQADTALRDFLVKKGYTEQELKDAGLVTRRRGYLNDMFRGRIMVPLSDGQGQVVGFTARLLEDIPNAPKYINTPQTLLYDKGRQVFGLHLAKESIRKSDYAVVVEGNLDVISSHQVGVTQVVATAGTAMTDYHLKSLSRLSNNVRLAYDGDEAGIVATERSIGIAEATGARLSIINLPDGLKDPDDVIRQDPKLWKVAIDTAQPAVEWLIARYAKMFNPGSAEGKRQITSKALAVITNLSDPVEQEYYIQELQTVTGASADALKEKLANISSKITPGRKRPMKPQKEWGRDPAAYQDSLLALCLEYPIIRPTLRKLDINCFAGDHRQQLAGFLQQFGEAEVKEDLPKELQSISTYVKILLLRSEERYGQWSEQDRYIEAAKLARDVTKQQKQDQKMILITKLREAENSGDEDVAAALRVKLHKLIRER